MIDFSSPPKYQNQVDLIRLEACLQTSLEKLGYAQDEAVTLKLTDNRTIHKLNKTYRGVDAPTDVLSFENDYLDPESGLHYLGDIVISIKKLRSKLQTMGIRYSKKWKCSLCTACCIFVAMTMLKRTSTQK